MNLATAKRALAITASTSSAWSLRVDANGKIDEQGEFVARPPVPYYGGKTVRRTGIDDATAAKEARDDKAFLDRVVFIASQRPRSRALLEFVYRNKLQIRFDADRTRDQGAGALVIINDISKRTRLSLRPHVPTSQGGPEFFRTMTLAHEDTHFLRNHAKFEYSSRHTLSSIKRMIRVQEDDADVGGTLAVAEFLVKYPADPPNAWRSPSAGKALLDYPLTTQAAIVSGLQYLENGRKDLYGAKVAASFADRDNSYYDEYMLKLLRDVAVNQRKNKRFDEMATFMQTDATTPSLIAEAITLSGRPYLDPKITHSPEFVELADTPGVRAAYDALRDEVLEYNKLGYFPNIEIGFKSKKPAAPEIRATPADSLKALIPSAHVIAATQGAVLSLNP